jgi:molybdate transport system substrate-binding protein
MVLVVACAGSSSGSSDSSSASAAAAPTTVRVLAASSLASVLPDLVDGFRREYPGVTVETSTGASTALVEQVRAGVGADVVLTADRSTADAAADAVDGNGAAGDRSEEAAPELFATNTLVIAVPVGNPGEVDGLDALSDPDLLVGLCAPQVPCGKYARQLLADAGVSAAVDTEEPDARSLMAKITSGDLDAGLVYRTDVLAAGPTALVVAVPGAAKVPVTYFAVALAQGAGTEFVDYLQGPGRKVLTAAGFGLP